MAVCSAVFHSPMPMSLFRLIRLPNLLIVALTQYLLYLRVVLPVLYHYGVTPALHERQFLLLVIITLMISAGGYIVNDIVDLRIDLVNKPDRVIVGRHISHATAYWLYSCLNLTGFIFAMYLAFVVERVVLLSLFPAAVVGLLWYSVYLKKRPLAGNVLVALYCAGVAALVWLAEQPALAQLPPEAARSTARLLGFYAVFAFLSTLFREIVKDLEDAHGDALGGARTAPVAWGTLTAKAIATGTCGLLLLALALGGYALQAQLYAGGLPFLGLTAGLSCVALFLLWRATTPRNYYLLSQLAKVIMLCGLLLLLFFK